MSRSVLAVPCSDGAALRKHTVHSVLCTLYSAHCHSPSYSSAAQPETMCEWICRMAGAQMAHALSRVSRSATARARLTRALSRISRHTYTVIQSKSLLRNLRFLISPVTRSASWYSWCLMRSLLFGFNKFFSIMDLRTLLLTSGHLPIHSHTSSILTARSSKSAFRTIEQKRIPHDRAKAHSAQPPSHREPIHRLPNFYTSQGTHIKHFCKLPAFCSAHPMCRDNRWTPLEAIVRTRLRSKSRRSREIFSACATKPSFSNPIRYGS